MEGSPGSSAPGSRVASPHVSQVYSLRSTGQKVYTLDLPPGERSTSASPNKQPGPPVMSAVAASMLSMVEKEEARIADIEKKKEVVAKEIETFQTALDEITNTRDDLEKSRDTLQERAQKAREEAAAAKAKFAADEEKAKLEGNRDAEEMKELTALKSDSNIAVAVAKQKVVRAERVKKQLKTELKGLEDRKNSTNRRQAALKGQLESLKAKLESHNRVAGAAADQGGDKKMPAAMPNARREMWRIKPASRPSTAAPAIGTSNIMAQALGYQGAENTAPISGNVLISEEMGVMKTPVEVAKEFSLLANAFAGGQKGQDLAVKIKKVAPGQALALNDFSTSAAPSPIPPYDARTDKNLRAYWNRPGVIRNIVPKKAEVGTMNWTEGMTDEDALVDGLITQRPPVTPQGAQNSARANSRNGRPHLFAGPM